MDNEKEYLMKEANTDEEAFNRLKKIIEILRVECPWDREQTHKTLRQPMIEEAYEVCEAIDTEDSDNLKEELGDVLLQVIFHGCLAEESGTFTLTDIINDECAKMIRRHPHVFSSEDIKSVDKVIEKWENIKREEHFDQSYTQRLQDVPRALPALIRSYKVQKRAADVGFDWPDVRGALDKLNEELYELIDAVEGDNIDNIKEELGDLLFSIVNLSRFLKVEPESALASSIKKFISRFQFIESEANRSNIKLEDMTLEEMDTLWEEAKKQGL